MRTKKEIKRQIAIMQEDYDNILDNIHHNECCNPDEKHQQYLQMLYTKRNEAKARIELLQWVLGETF